MSTQYERMKEMLVHSHKDWPDLRKASGITRAGIKKWRDGNFKDITSRNLYALADLFGCDARWLALGEGEPFPARDPGPEPLQDIWAATNPEGHKAIIDHARYVLTQPRFLRANTDETGATRPAA